MSDGSEEDKLMLTGRSENGSDEPGTSGLPLFNSMADFNTLCKTLSMPVDIQGKAESVLETIMSEVDQQEEIEMSQKDMFVCALYVAMIDARMPYGPHDPQLKEGHLEAPVISIAKLLQKSNTSVKKLLQQMKLVKEWLYLSEAVSQHFKTLEKTFCIMCYLAHTFDRLCGGVFRDEDKPHMESNEENIYPSLPESEGVGFRKRLCWLLFLLAKQQLMGDNLDLLHGFSALVCCLEYVMRTTPSFLLNSPYDVIRIGCLNVSEYGSLPLLGRMCEDFEINREETEDLSRSYMEPFFTEQLTREGELDMEQLEESYMRQHVKEGDLNELLFLSKHPLYSPSSNNSNGTSPVQSSSTGNGTPPMTPVRSALNSVHQLRNTLASATDQPSCKLLDYFQICTCDPKATIAERLQQLRTIFVEKFDSVMSPHGSVADTRFSLGIKLYYRMLELLLNNDSKRLSISVLDTLLNKEDFHKSLIACCLEVVLVTYGLTKSYLVNGGDTSDSPFSFPWILETLNIQAYDFSKVLESFIRAEPRLPSDVVKHLQNVEYRILENLAWKEGSSLFEAIRVCDKGIVTPPRNSSLELANPTNDQVCPSAAQMFLSPAPGRQASHSLSQPSCCAVSSHGGAVPPRSQSLTTFFNKVYRLAYYRLQRLCSVLQINKDLLHKIWTCFENCVTYRVGILKNRHLDQILMCSIYGVCKVVEKDIKFKTIVMEYAQHLPCSKPEVFKSVWMTGSKYDSIINFYNQIFMVNMKTYILQFSNSSRQAAPTLSPVPHPAVQAPSSPYSLPGKKNFIVSPLKKSPFKAPHSPSQLTPASRQLFCFGDRPGSAEKLRNINASVSAAGKRKTELSPKSEPKEKAKRLIVFDQPPSDYNQSTSTIAAVRKLVPSATVGCNAKD